MFGLGNQVFASGCEFSLDCAIPGWSPVWGSFVCYSSPDLHTSDVLGDQIFTVDEQYADSDWV